MKYDNGRVLSAEYLEIYVTEQDYITICNNYTWSDMEVARVWRCKKDYLPRPFMEYILELYANKTELKDIAGKEDLYLQSKQYINSMYGMCVTALIQSDVKYDGGEWNIKPLTEEDVEKCIQAMMNALGEVSAFDEEHGGNDAELIKETLFHLSEFEKEL